jgi:hypothetical protein
MVSDLNVEEEVVREGKVNRKIQIQQQYLEH